MHGNEDNSDAEIVVGHFTASLLAASAAIAAEPGPPFVNIRALLRAPVAARRERLACDPRTMLVQSDMSDAFYTTTAGQHGT